MELSRLKAISIFQDIPDDELSQIAPFADEVSVTEGKELVSQGDYSYEFMAIEEGEAEVLRDGEHVADLGPGDFFGEIGLIERDRRTATVRAKTAMRLITLTGWDLKRLEKLIPAAADRVRQALEQRRAPDEG